MEKLDFELMANDLIKTADSYNSAETDFYDKDGKIKINVFLCKHEVLNGAYHLWVHSEKDKIGEFFKFPADADSLKADLENLYDGTAVLAKDEYGTDKIIAGEKYDEVLHNRENPRSKIYTINYQVDSYDMNKMKQKKEIDDLPLCEKHDSLEFYTKESLIQIVVEANNEREAFELAQDILMNTKFDSGLEIGKGWDSYNRKSYISRGHFSMYDIEDNGKDFGRVIKRYDDRIISSELLKSDDACDKHGKDNLYSLTVSDDYKNTLADFCGIKPDEIKTIVVSELNSHHKYSDRKYQMKVFYKDDKHIPESAVPNGSKCDFKNVSIPLEEIKDLVKYAAEISGGEKCIANNHSIDYDVAKA